MVLATAWFQPKLALTTGWFGPDARIEAALGRRSDAAAIAQVIGPTGPPGSVGAFGQSFAMSPSWTVNHNLGRSPAAVRVLSPGGIEVEAEVAEISLNQIIVLFASAQAGRVIVL